MKNKKWVIFNIINDGGVGVFNFCCGLWYIKNQQPYQFSIIQPLQYIIVHSAIRIRLSFQRKTFKLVFFTVHHQVGPLSHYKPAHEPLEVFSDCRIISLRKRLFFRDCVHAHVLDHVFEVHRLTWKMAFCVCVCAHVHAHVRLIALLYCRTCNVWQYLFSILSDTLHPFK